MVRLSRSLLFMSTLGSGAEQTPGDDSRPNELCVPNISPAERRKRLLAGAVQFAVSLVILGWMLAPGVDRMWRIAMLLPWWGAAAGFFQWRDKT